MKKDSASSAQKSPEILIAEDSPTQAAQIKNLLESNNYKVTVANDGKEALDKLLKHKPALVISDIMMPEMNGYELCKKIKSNINSGNIPVILLTALSDTEEIIKGLSCGADSFISKPYNEKYLISQIEKNLSEETGTNQEKVPFSTQILFKGKKRYVQAEQQKVINLLVNIYEGAIQQNEKLIQTRAEMRLLNDRLESIVVDRTSDLSEEIKLSNQIIERLRESENKYRTYMEKAPLAIFVTDLDGHFLDCNPKTADLLGYEATALKNMSIINIYSEDDRDTIQHALETLKQSGYAQGEFKIKRGDGTFVWVLLNISAVENELALGYCNNITERKQTEKKLIQSEYELKRAQQITHIGSWYLDVVTNEVIWTEELYKMYGFNPALPPPPYTEHMKLFTPESWELLSSSLTKTIETGVPYELELQTVRKDMINGWMWVRGEAQPDSEGNIVALWGAAQDITARKQSEETLLLKNLVFDNSLAANSIADVNGVITEANNTFLRFWGYPAKNEVIGKPLPLFFSDPNEVVAVFEALKGTGEWEGNFSAKRSDGSVFAAQGLATILRDAQDRIVGYQSAVLDVTKSKLAEDKVSEQLEELRRWNDAASDREERILEVKREVNELLIQAGKPPRYESVT